VVVVGQLLAHDHLVLVNLHLLQPGLVEVEDLDTLSAALVGLVLVVLVVVPSRQTVVLLGGSSRSGRRRPLLGHLSHIEFTGNLDNWKGKSRECD